ncbi:ABC transporter related protein [alpha proteobacterium BAL199]|nr:ABC transporter related protein [alpha proteobacterium BAL199]
MTAVLEVTGVTVTFGGVTALDDVSFVVHPGELLGLIGPNGAGKTTMLKVVTGIVVPQAGTVRLANADLAGLPTHARMRRGLGLAQQLVRTFDNVSTIENVMLAAGRQRTASPWAALFQVNRSVERRIALELLERVGIADAAEQRPDHLPLGYRKRLQVARALALDPALLLLDEPLAGLNHVEAAALADVVRGIADDGRTVVLIEHNLGEVLRITDRLVVLDSGRKIGDGEPGAVIRDPVVHAAYIGEGEAA